MTLRILSITLVLAGCGARTGALLVDESFDAGTDVADAGRDGFVPRPDGGFDAGCVPVDDLCVPLEVCADGDDDDCDGTVDEGCACEPGAVQPCFAGPPGRRDVGACQDGAQTCTGDGSWGDCLGGIVPIDVVCTGRDDLCNGCSDERVCEIDCPSPGDPRVPDGQPFDDYPLRARDFYLGPASGFRWRVEGGPCDGLAPRLESFELRGAMNEDAVLVPKLSGDYRVTLEVTTPAGELLSCSWLVHVAGPGLRVEMCYPESETLDLDLYLHRPNDMRRWFAGSPENAFSALPEASCGWHDCEAVVRQTTHPVTGGPVTRPDWGYADSPLEACENGPQGEQWRANGACANPRLDIDNNLSEGIGVPENINVDRPRDGDVFRVMVQNFSGDVARPVVNIYCAGRRVATYGQAPDTVPNFRGRNGSEGYGAMWRVVDVTARVDADGETSGCDVTPLHPPGAASAYHVTNDDPSY